MLRRLRERETDLPKLESESADLMESTGDKRIQAHVQQVKSRFQSLLTTTKDIVKKCEEIVKASRLYQDKYNESIDWLKDAEEKLGKIVKASEFCSTKEELEKNIILMQDLTIHVVSSQLIKATVEAGEKLYTSTGPIGRETIAQQLQEIQQAYDTLTDKVNETQRELENKLAR